MQDPPVATAYTISGSTGHICACSEIRRYAASDGVSPGIFYVDVRYQAAGWVTHEVTGLEVAVISRPAFVRHEVDYEISVPLSKRENLIVRRPGLEGTSRWSGALTSRLLSFSAPAIERIIELPIGKIPLPGEGADLRAKRSTLQMLRSLSWVYAEDPSPDPLIIDSLHLAVLRSVLVEPTRGRSVASTLSSPQTTRVCAYIKDNFTSDITVADLAKVAGFSQGHFIRAFHQTIGLTPYQYIMRERVAAAEALIRTSGLPISIIARKAGFTSSSAMSRTFRKCRGHSPTGR